MPVYKILTLNKYAYKGPFTTQVLAPYESWQNLETALNELGAHGWEVEHYVYGSVGGAEQAQNELIGVVLVNKSSTEAQEIDRLIAVAEAEIAALTARLAEIDPESIEGRDCAFRLQELSEVKLKELRDRRSKIA